MKHVLDQISPLLNSYIPGGLVLYSRSFNPNYAAIENSPSSPVVALFESVLVDGKRQQDAGFEKNGFSVRWARENELGLVFVVGVWQT
jgi:signal recognition particle receptor subunit alpha